MVTDSDIMLNGKSVAKDNRIAPGEVRGEEFCFDVPDNLKAEVNAYVVYLYKPLLLRETEMKIEMDADKKTLRGK